MTEQKPSIVKPWQFLTWRIAAMCKTAWTTSMRSGHILRSGPGFSKRAYNISNAERAAMRPYEVGTWTGFARARCGMEQEEWSPYGLSYPSTPARVWTQRTLPGENRRGVDPVPHQSPAVTDV